MGKLKTDQNRAKTDLITRIAHSKQAESRVNKTQKPEVPLSIRHERRANRRLLSQCICPRALIGRIRLPIETACINVV